MRTSPAASKKEFRWGTIIIILIFLLGILITFYTVGHIQKEMKNDLLQKAKIAAGSINQERLKKLTGTTADLNDPDYLRIKEQLKQIREAQTNCKFLYLIGRKKNGEVFFYVDSQSPESNDYAPPGLIYEEVPDKYLSVFTSMKGTTVGPVEDRWGKLMTALIPVKKPESDEIFALLGMDYTTNYWIKEIFKRTTPIVVIIVIFILLVYYIQQLRILKQQKASEKQIKEREEQYKVLFESAADGILIGDESGTIVNANKSFCHLTGYDKKELLGTNIYRLFDEEELRKKPFDYQSVLNGETVLNERQLQKKDGTFLTIEMNTRKVGDGRLQAFFRDITDRKRTELLIKEKNEELLSAEEELKASNDELREINDMLARQTEELKVAKDKAEESDNLKSVFLANMSHEIRTPMNGIIGFSEILAQENFSREEQVEYLQTIYSLAHNLMQIIDDIIDISKIEANQLTIKEETFRIHDVINELYKIYKIRISKNTDKPVELRTENSNNEKNCQIYTDLNRLKQILNNLLNNAVKFTEKGVIEVGYKLRNRKEWLFWVKDTGIGVPAKDQQHIFERFRQAGNIDHSMQVGTGLGLTISKNLVELLGGKIWVESKQGEGTIFYFTIPCKHKEEKFSPIAQGENGDFNWKGKTILIVEDDLPSREYLKRALMPSGADLIAKETGEKGLKEFEENKNIDLILMDIRLPGIDGTEVIKIIRKKGSKTPIIAQTAHSMNEDRIEYLQAGANDYLAKPIAINELLSMVNKYI